MDKNKTAVDLLVDSLPLRIQNMYASEIENAKAIEKQQIEKAFQYSMVAIVLGKILSPKEYYEVTYEK